MKIELQYALDLIESADVVKLLDGDGYITPHITTDDIRGDYDNEVMIVTWDEDGQDYAIRVPEQDNEKVEREGHKLTFVDNEGEPFELHLFREVPILA
jgi:hypothetical protein